VSVETSANCPHCGSPTIYAIPVASAAEAQVSPNELGDPVRLAALEVALLHLGNIVSGRLPPGSLDPVGTASFDQFRSWTLGIVAP
jgi:hypothetical protein